MRLKTSDLKAYRDELLELQAGLDPITGLAIIDPCLDHCHKTGKVRDVLDRRTNAWEGKVLNAFRRCGLHKIGAHFPACLRRMADYAEADWQVRPLHPKHRTEEEKRLRRNKKARLNRKKK